jgi:phospholipid/cholesterol/gamma-HCH transport system substrate-binding protein
MGKETHALMTGLFVVILGSALILIALWLGNYGNERIPYIVVTQGEVSGLNPDSTVVYRGVPAGKVASITFDPNNMRNIFVRIEVEKGLPITKGTYATLRIQGLTGLAQVELHDSGENPEPLLTKPDHPAWIPLRPSLFDKLTESGLDILPQLTQLAARMNDLVNDDNRMRVQRILEATDSASERLVSLEKRLDGAIAEWPAVSTKIGRAMADMAAMAQDVKQTSQQIRTLTVTTKALLASTQSTGDTLAVKTLPQVNGLLDDMRKAFARLSELSSLLERDPQALLYGKPPPVPGPGEPGFQEPK